MNVSPAPAPSSRSRFSRVGWAVWALVPVAALTYHFGPGQLAFAQDRAARMQNRALDAEQGADAAQAAAYDHHLAAIDARRKALLTQSPEDAAAAREATEQEDAAYLAAAAAWKQTADLYAEVQSALGTPEDGATTEEQRSIRLAHARATVRSGDIWPGIAELEGMLDEMDETNAVDDNAAALARTAREELATAYYYGARLLRLSGMPPQEWKIESGKARQHFRYLAESALADDDGDASTERAENYQRNVEVVLNLEQSSLVEIEGKPLPRNSPCNCKQGNRPCNGKKPGKKPNGPKQDARKAGGADDIPAGW